MAKNFFWFVFALFVGTAIYTGWHPGFFDFNVRLGGLKFLVMLCFAAFLGYSIYCSSRESLPATIQKMARLHWGRQIGIDLYIGLSIFLGIVFAMEGSPLAAAAWILPTLLFGNLATLLYLSIHFDAIVSRLNQVL